jgi:predicted NBD/HSP70 family sugar kinase
MADAADSTIPTRPAQLPPVARQLSVRAIMETILLHGPTSRAGLAELTGLSRQTTTQVVLELERDGWLEVSGRMQGRIGRSAPTYDLKATAAFVLGIRLEGEIVQMALADIRGDVVAEINAPTDPSGGIAVLRQIGTLYRAMIGKAGVPAAKVRVAVVGSPGVVDPVTGHIDIAPSIPHLGDINVVEELRAEIGVPLAIENGVKLSALGELWQGVARGARNFAYFGIGRGVGMGIVSDGKLLRGGRGAAGEIAYLPLGGDPFDPAGFATGTFETAVNADALLGRYRGYGGMPGASVADIFAAYDCGEAAARAAIEEISRIIVLAVRAIQAVIDADLIVFGGSIGRRPQLAACVQDLLPRVMRERPTLMSSALGDRATIVGALGEALHRLHADLFGVDAVRRELTLTDLGQSQRSA